MKASLNCIFLGMTAFSDSFTVSLYGKNNTDGEVFFGDLKIGHIKFLICREKDIKINNYNDLNLWKADFAYVYKLKDLTEEQICKDSELLIPIIYFKKYFPNQDAVDKSLIFVQVPVTNTPNKRIKLEDLNSELMRQTTTEYLQDLLHPFDERVSYDNINEYLDAPLRKKLPANGYYCRNYPGFLDYEGAMLLPDLCTVVGEVMRPYRERPNQETDTSNIVNNHIYHMMDVVGTYISKCGLEWVRNNKIDEFSIATSIRPDVTVYYKNVLVMMGGEKDIHSKLLIAANELNDYFSFWNPLAFGDLPFVFGFSACGTSLQFYYYHVIDSSTKPIRVEIGDLLLLGTENKLNNLQALRYTINIIRIFRTFDHYGVIQTPLLKLYDVNYRDHGTVTIAPDKVAKAIRKETIKDEDFHETLYQETLPGLGHYKNVEYRTTKNTIYLTFGPVGYLSIPKSENDLRLAILYILEFVEKLHDEEVGVVHRDIRWDNVIKLTDGKWMLIDFEEAAKIGVKRTTLRIAAPEYENGNDNCQASGDIWMIGKLIDDPRIKFPLSEKAQKFRNRLMNVDSNQRPTAIDALKDDWFEEMESEE